MRYRYFYQTKENESREGWIAARDRNDAYAQLRKRGIRPYRLLGRNPLAWRRWAAVSVLIVAAAFAGAVAVREASSRRSAYAFEDRAQVYGDPAVLAELTGAGWRSVFADSGDAWLARHATPGVAYRRSDGVDESCAPTTVPVRIDPTDPPEVAKMKRMVNGMKRELAEYLRADGTLADYMALCDERLATERGIRENIERELKVLETRAASEGHDAVAEAWSKKNALLRSFGLPTVLMPDEVSWK